MKPYYDDGRDLQSGFDFSGSDPEVRLLPHGEAHDFVVRWHYSGRFPTGATHIYGKIDNGIITGVCVFGSPASPWVSVSATGQRNVVLELQRLALVHNKPNEASWFIARALKHLATVWRGVVVSYADTAAGHHGGVYQACGFNYGGISKERTDIAADGKHARHHGGDHTKRQHRSAKHRYWIYVPRSYTKMPCLWPSLRYPKPRDDE